MLDDEVQIIGVDLEDLSDIVIGETVKYGGKSFLLSGIEDNAFRNNNKIKSVSLPDNIYILSDALFSGCSNLSVVNLPRQTLKLGSNMFMGCVKLEKIKIPKTVISIGSSCFRSCSSLKTIDLTDTDVTDLLENLFYDCSSLSEIRLPVGLKTIANHTFYNCKNLLSIDLNRVHLIGDEAFYGCQSISELNIPSSCSQISNGVFNGMTSLKTVRFESGDVIKIGHNGKLNVSSIITPFPNPSDVDERRTGFRNGYYDGLFYGLPIEHLVINRNIELPKYYERTMGNPTSSYSTVYNDIVYYPPFYGLTNLKSVEIGENVSAICKNQIEAVVNAVPTTMNCTNFGKCDNIEVVVAKNPKAPIGGVFSATTYKDAELFLPNGDAESYKADENWKHFSKIREAEFIPIDSISFEVERITMNTNDSCKLHPIISPANASIMRLKWYSSAPNKVAVSDDGIITSFNKGGEAVITAASADGSNLSATCAVSIKPRVESISLSPNEWSGFKGESFKIEATILPEDAVDKTLTWTSSDESVAKVDDTGQVETTGIGKCIITATAVDGSEVNATCAVTVMRKLVESLIINPEEFLGTAGDSFIIETTVLPEDATNKKLMFSSDNTRVAKVYNNGKVTIKNEGIAYIKVMTTDGSDIKAWCAIFSTSGIEDLFKDDSCRYDVYTITGMLVQKAADKGYVNRLSKGIYILVSGNKVVKLNLTDK